MSFGIIAEASGAVLLVALFVLREIVRCARVQYEYRWETFAVRGDGNRQLLHIRQTEIQSVARMTLSERLAGFGHFKHLTRGVFGPRVVIRSKLAHTVPVVVSWEGRAIAGLTPTGLMLRADEQANERKG